MVLITGLLSLLLWAALVSAQRDSCFKKSSINAEVLAGDQYSLDLDQMITGNKIEITLEQQPDIDSPHGDVLVNPFPFEHAETVLNYKVDRCRDHTAGLVEGDYLFLCDSNKIVFIHFSMTNGDVTSNTFSVVGSEADKLDCDSISTNLRKTHAYVLCTSGVNQAMHIYKVDLTTGIPGFPRIIEQKEGEKLKTNLKMLVDDYPYDGVDTATIYVWENINSPLETRFRAFRDSGAFVGGGTYFSAAKGNIFNMAPGQLKSFLYDGNRAYALTMKDSVASIQKCSRSPIYSKFYCDTKVISIGESNGIFVFVPLYENLPDSKLQTVYNVLADTIVQGIFNPDTMTYVEVGRHSIKGHSLKQIQNVFKSGNHLYLCGSTSIDNGIMDLVVKFRIRTSLYEEASYAYNSPSYILVRRDPYNVHFDDLITIGIERLSQNTTVNFYKVKKNLFLVNTRPFAENPKAELMVYNLNCKDADGKTGKLKVTLSTQLEVNGNPRLDLPDRILAYTGSKEIYAPTNGDDISGNAPQLSLSDISDTSVKLDYQMTDKVPASFLSRKVDNIEGLRHIGENIFAVYSNNTVVFFKCERASSQKVYDCGDLYLKPITLVEDHQKFIKADVVGKSIVIVTASKLELDGGNPNTTIRAMSIEDGQNIMEPTTFNFSTKLAEIKMIENQVVIIVAGSKSYKTQQGLWYLKFELNEGIDMKNFGLIRYNSKHICPTELSFTPRETSMLYIASICDDSSVDNHVFQMSINLLQPAVSELTETFQILRSRNFRICAQSRLINIIDLEQDTIYSLDSQSSLETRLRLPLKDYGIEALLRHTCDQDNNILQVIGCKADKKTDCKLITYRANEIKPNGRVHSIVSLDKPYERIASSFNDANDDTLTVLFGSSTDLFQLYKVEVDGPHIKFLAEDTKKEGEVLLELQLTFPGPTSKTISQKTTIELKNQRTDVKYVLKDDKVRPMMNNTRVDLERYGYIDGPYHSVAPFNKSKVIVADRVYKISSFGRITETFDDSIIYGKFILGTKRDGYTTYVTLWGEDNKKVDSIEMKEYTTLSIHTVEKVPEQEYYFFVFANTIRGVDKIFSIYTLDNGKTWIKASTLMENSGYRQVQFVNGPGKNILFGGFNNINDYSVAAAAMKLDGDKIDIYARKFFNFRDNIADFEITYVGGSDIILIVGVEYAKQASFYWLQIIDGIYLAMKSQSKVSLVPNYQETHQDIQFKCHYQNKTKTERLLLCAHTGKNMYSYVSRFELILDPSKPTEFLSRTDVATKLKNVVNTRPIKMDFLGDYVVMVVKNEAPLAEGAQQTVSSLFTEKYLILVYDIDTLTKVVPETETPERDVYKVITADDMEATTKDDLSKLSPRLFYDEYGSVNIGINIAIKNNSIDVYEISELAIILDPKNAEKGELKIGFMGLDSKVNSIAVKDIYRETNYPKPDDPPGPTPPGPTPPGPKPDDDSSKKKAGFLLPILIVVVLVVLGLVIFVVIKMNKSEGELDKIYSQADKNDHEESLGEKLEDSHDAEYTKL